MRSRRTGLHEFLGPQRTGPALDDLKEHAEAKADDHMNAVYNSRMNEAIDAYFAGMFKTPEVQRMIREQCRAAVQRAVSEVIERQGPQLRHDIEVFIGDRWQESVEAIAQSILADELGKIRARLTGGRT